MAVPEITINGPSIPSDVHNMVLRDALFHSPIGRLSSSSDYHVIEVGVREARGCQERPRVLCASNLAIDVKDLGPQPAHALKVP